MQKSRLQELEDVYEYTRQLCTELADKGDSNGIISKELEALLGLGILVYEMLPAISQLKKELDGTNQKLNSLFN